MRTVNGSWMILSVLLGCGPGLSEVVPHADGTTGTAEGTVSTSEPPLPASTGSSTAQAEGSGGATGHGADTSDGGDTTEGVQLGTSTGAAASTGEVASTSGTSTGGEPGTSTGTDASCDEQFGAALDYIYCTETDVACHFNATTSGSDCNAMCASLGSTCLAAFDNPNIAGEECNVIRPNTDTCDTDRGTEICACAK